MNPDPATTAAFVALALAAIQLIAASWRDLGALSVAGVGAALVALQIQPPASPPVFAGLLLGAAAISAIAWGRAARHRVGRPANTGVALAAATGAALAPWIVPRTVHGIPADPAILALAVPALAISALAGIASLDRPGPVYFRPRWYVRVRVEGGSAR